jgi:siroheme synthase-like protein
MRYQYPMMLDVTDRLAVIVGGGAVAARKAAGLIECGATRVRCVAPAFDGRMPPAVERVEARYAPAHLDGAGLVFAATDDPAVNESVVRDARTRGLLVNRADATAADDDNGDADKALGDFSTPAKWRHGPVTLTVSAGGSPALAVLIRNGLMARWDPRWSAMAEAMAALRPILLGAAAVDAAARAAAFRDLATEEALAVLEAGSFAGLYDWLLGRHPALPGASEART